MDDILLLAGSPYLGLIDIERGIQTHHLNRIAQNLTYGVNLIEEQAHAQVGRFIQHPEIHILGQEHRLPLMRRFLPSCRKEAERTTFADNQPDIFHEEHIMQRGRECV